MVAADRVDVELWSLATEERAGAIRIGNLPGRSTKQGHALIEVEEGSGSDGSAPIQLLEDGEYRFELLGLPAGVIIEPSDLFDFDPDSSGGRLRPGRHTGTIEISAFSTDGNAIGRGSFEVRSRKLRFQDEYRWMLSRIAEEAAELIMLRFAASEQRFESAAQGTPETVYQRFAFVRSMLESEAFESAVNYIVRRPHVEYRQIEERIPPAKGIRGGSRLALELAKAGPRFRLPPGIRVAGLETLPERITQVRHVETIDTAPNRFFKYALESWRSLARNVSESLVKVDTASGRRGAREAALLENKLTQILLSPMFRDLGPMTVLPAGNQVLQKREGYRYIYRSFLLTDVAAGITWTGADDVFSAGQRDVATLYEYWVFLELARIVSDLTGGEFDKSQLLRATADGMSLQLRRRKQTALSGSVIRNGRRVGVELWFNKSFSAESWTERLRPDCSIRVTPEGGLGDTSATWLHFDAKYRIKYDDVFRGPRPASDDNEEGGLDEQLDAPASGDVMSDDLLKMHAYRDAVRRSVGAYVLYPGTDDKPSKKLRKYHEVLPGLGAFVLRPTEDGHAAAAGSQDLREFLDDVLDHVAAQGTGRERVDFWEQETYRGWDGDDQQEIRLRRSEWLETPPADTPVLLGYVRDESHLEWVEANGLYNLRADGRDGSVTLRSPAVGAAIVVLYNPEWTRCSVFETTGALYPMSSKEMAESGYSDPGGSLYVCVDLGEQLRSALEGVSGADVAAITQERDDGERLAAPFVSTWDRLQGLVR